MKNHLANSLVVQWLGLSAFTAEGQGSIPGWGTTLDPLFVNIEKVNDKPRRCIKKQRDHFADKGLHSQSYGFSSSYVWMWELDHKESWAPKMLLNFGVQEDSWKSLGLQGDPTSQP